MSEKKERICKFKLGNKNYKVNSGLNESTVKGRIFKNIDEYCKVDFENEVIKYFLGKAKQIETEDVANDQSYSYLHDSNRVITSSKDIGLTTSILKDNNISKEIKNIFEPYCLFFGEKDLGELATGLAAEICKGEKNPNNIGRITNAIINKAKEVSKNPEIQRQLNYGSTVANLAAQHQSSSNSTDDSSASALGGNDEGLGNGENVALNIGASINELTPSQQGQQIGE